MDTADKPFPDAAPRPKQPSQATRIHTRQAPHRQSAAEPLSGRALKLVCVSWETLRSFVDKLNIT